MGSLADRIEAHILRLLARSDGFVEVRRYEVAARFECVPSQVTYVLSTRFTPDRGYFVESRRGGGGYIRIVSRHPRPEPDSLQTLWDRLGNSLTEAEADAVVQLLARSELLTRRQKTLARQAMRHEAARLQPPLDEVMRAAVIKGMLIMLSSEPDGH